MPFLLAKVIVTIVPFIHLFIHSFKKYVLCIFSTQYTVLGDRNVQTKGLKSNVHLSFPFAISKTSNEHLLVIVLVSVPMNQSPSKLLWLPLPQCLPLHFPITYCSWFYFSVARGVLHVAKNTAKVGSKITSSQPSNDKSKKSLSLFLFPKL